MLKPCECGSRRFKVDAVYVAHDYIELPEDGSDDFEVYDTQSGDGEWFDTGIVECVECGKKMAYMEWANQDDSEEIELSQADVLALE